MFLFLPQPFAPEHWELLQHGGNYPGEWHCHLTHFRPMYTHYCTRVHVCVRVVSWHSQLCSDLTRSIFLSAYGEKRRRHSSTAYLLLCYLYTQAAMLELFYTKQAQVPEEQLSKHAKAARWWLPSSSVRRRQKWVGNKLNWVSTHRVGSNVQMCLNTLILTNNMKQAHELM